MGKGRTHEAERKNYAGKRARLTFIIAPVSLLLLVIRLWDRTFAAGYGLDFRFAADPLGTAFFMLRVEPSCSRSAGCAGLLIEGCHSDNIALNLNSSGGAAETHTGIQVTLLAAK